MITEVTGNLVIDDAQALVNTVNTVGVMGKGLALQFKRAYPDVFKSYERACKVGDVLPGKIHAIPIEGGARWVLNFPTKRHWRANSRIEDIEDGLDDLARFLVEENVKSVAVPPLGCGNGGLPWPQVRDLIYAKLGDLTTDIRLYGLGTPAAVDMPTRTPKPELTTPRARLLASLGRYISVALSHGMAVEATISLLEVHKIAYLLQSGGADLGLTFDKGHIGPYSPRLQRGLATMEGHYILGFGDGTGGARADVRLLPGTTEAAETALVDDEDFKLAWQRLADTSLGYEYPEGMELLASVHYVATGDTPPPPTVLVRRLQNWNPRKARLFTVTHVESAYTRLTANHLLPSVA